MLITVNRRPSKNGATIGDLSVTRKGAIVFSCVTVEDQLREIPGQPVASWKIKDQSAIPAGNYDLNVTLSARFKCALPLIKDVPGFTGIRIHRGNRDEDSSGCILPGLAVAPDAESVLQSRDAFEELFSLILDALNAGESIKITVNNPPNYSPAARAA